MGSEETAAGSTLAATFAPAGARSIDGEFIGLTFPVAQLSSLGAFASYVFG
jgi:hypothetical protein